MLFQRLSVILLQLSLYRYSITRLLARIPMSPQQSRVAFVLLYCHFGYLLADNMHFQYNSMLQSFHLLSLACLLSADRLLSALLFTILLNLKHIYLYMAPVYFLFLLRKDCLSQPRYLGKYAAVVGGGTLLAFLPFLGDLSQIVSRLFPVKRGLVHSLWAGNVWALYCALDKALQLLLGTPPSSFFDGTVQEKTFSVLPNVGMHSTLLLVLLSSLPIYRAIFRQHRSGLAFIRLCAD